MKELIFGEKKRPLWIVDQVAQEEALPGIEKFFKELPYSFFESDREDTEYLKHLVHNFSIEDALENPVLSTYIDNVKDILLSHNISFGKLERVYCNFILYGDFQYAHEDGPVWTGLYFLNQRWDSDWGGEFQAYHGDHKGLSTSVSPVPGRLTVFDGEILHRGGVPSKICIEPRLTLVVKFAKQ